MQPLVSAVRALVATVALAASVGLAEARSQIYAPRNDNFASAFKLASSPRLQPGHLYNTSRQLGEPKLLPSSRGKTVWYTYTATQTGRAVVTVTTGSLPAAPLQLGVYRGTALTALNRVGSVQVAGSGNQTAGSVVFDTVKDTVYKIQVDIAPQTYFEGNFLIGLVAYGANGGLPAFVERPSIIEENGSDRKILVVNGFRKKVNLQAGVSNINEFLTVSNTGSSLNVGASSWYTVGDDWRNELPAFGPRAGTLLLTARDAAANTVVVGSGSTPLFLIRAEPRNAPNVVVRFERPALGTRIAEFISSRVVVKNTGRVTAFGCRFEGGSLAFDPSFTEVLSTGSSGSVNVPFNLAAGQTRTYIARFAPGAYPYWERMYLECASDNGTVTSDELSSFWAYPEFGMASRVLVRPAGTNSLAQVALADFSGATIVVALTNAGEYAGEFEVTVRDDEYLKRADVAYYCVSDSTGTCLSALSLSPRTIDLAVGEVGYVALRVERGNDRTGTGLVYIDVDSTGSPNRRFAGRGGFEVIRKP